VLRELYDDPSYVEARSGGDPQAWARRAQQIICALPETPLAVLDFGASQGHLVRALRGLGLTALGVEPSPAARVIALEQGVELHAELADLPSQRFDAVTMLHSLEHVEDPVTTLIALREMLNSGGSIFIEVPHAGSADMWVPRSRRAILDVPAHLHHFTPATLEFVVERAGFAVLRTQVFNSLPVETALARRRDSRRRSSEPSRAATKAARGAARLRSANRRGTRIDLLHELLRARLPGPKFQLIARRG
jgi:SAM-dependent methyltransferase